jgi:phage protein D
VGSPQARFTKWTAVIAGIDVPLVSARCTLSSQSAMGTAEATTSLGLLANSGIDLITASQTADGATFDLWGYYDNSKNLLFSGVVDSCDGNFGEDEITIRGRDHAASLADGRQTVASLNFRNQTIGQIVTQIANKFGLTPLVTDPGVMAGPLMNGENFYGPHPQTYWAIIQTLADQVGYEAYVTPDQTLYFGPEQDKSAINVNFGADPHSGAENPLLSLAFTYNPRNNSNITVKVISSMPQQANYVLATATAKQLQVGSDQRKPTALLEGRGLRVNRQGSSGGIAAPKSVYYIFAPGMSPDQAQAKAQSAADDLAKRQIIIDGTLEGLPSLQLHSKINLLETTIDLLGFESLDYNVAQVGHSFDMENGFNTTFSAIARIS